MLGTSRYIPVIFQNQKSYTTTWQTLDM